MIGECLGDAPTTGVVLNDHFDGRIFHDAYLMQLARADLMSAAGQ